MRGRYVPRIGGAFTAMLTIREVDGVSSVRMARSFLGRGLYFVYAYIVDDLLIDTGIRHARKELLALARTRGITRAVNTHAHEDHAGNDQALERELGVQVLAHREALPKLANPKPLKFFQRFLFGEFEPCVAAEVGPSIETASHAFDVLYTPGHCDEHISLYEGKHGWVFSGDLYIGGQTRAAHGEERVYLTIDSLRRIASLDPSILLGGHNLIMDPRDGLVAKADYLETLGRKALALYGKGRTVREIRNELLGAEGLVRYITQGHFSGEKLIRSFLEGRVR